MTILSLNGRKSSSTNIDDFVNEAEKFGATKLVMRVYHKGQEEPQIYDINSAQHNYKQVKEFRYFMIVSALDKDNNLVLSTKSNPMLEQSIYYDFHNKVFLPLDIHHQITKISVNEGRKYARRGLDFKLTISHPTQENSIRKLKFTQTSRLRAVNLPDQYQ